jgi:hypothetical protein
MKINIQDDSINIDELKQAIETHFIGKYEIENRNNMLVVAKSKIYGAMIVPRKKSIVINGNFPTMTGQLIFSLTLVLLGILIPLIIYFLTFHKKLKQVENELGDFIKEQYKNKIT